MGRRLIGDRAGRNAGLVISQDAKSDPDEYHEQSKSFCRSDKKTGKEILFLHSPRLFLELTDLFGGSRIREYPISFLIFADGVPRSACRSKCSCSLQVGLSLLF